jgi:hypothetical protein
MYILNADLEMGCVDIYFICMYILCIYLVYSLYIPCICRPPAYPWDIMSLIFGVYVYTCYIYVILLVNTMDILSIFHVYVEPPCWPPHIPWIYLVYTKWVCSVPLFIMICQWYTKYIHCIFNKYTWYIIGISL